MSLPQLRLPRTQVLVVDDDRDVLAALSASLRRAGAEVVTAERASEALDAMRVRRFDLLICDLVLREGSGYDIVRTVRSWTEEDGGRIPALAITGFAAEEEREKALAAGFTDYLPKPAGDRLVQMASELVTPFSTR